MRNEILQLGWSAILILALPGVASAAQAEAVCRSKYIANQVEYQRQAANRASARQNTENMEGVGGIAGLVGGAALGAALVSAGDVLGASTIGAVSGMAGASIGAPIGMTGGLVTGAFANAGEETAENRAHVIDLMEDVEAGGGTTFETFAGSLVKSRSEWVSQSDIMTLLEEAFSTNQYCARGLAGSNQVYREIGDAADRLVAQRRNEAEAKGQSARAAMELWDKVTFDMSAPSCKECRKVSEQRFRPADWDQDPSLSEVAPEVSSAAGKI